MTENAIVKQLQEIAARLTTDIGHQKELMQEMFVELVRIQTSEPGQPLDWYLKRCEHHAQRRMGLNSQAPSADDRRQGLGKVVPVSADQVVIQGELITRSTIDLILPHLSDMQQRVLFLLMKGCGVREAARELGVTHPAVIKHRKKIARIARELLQESEGVGVAVAVHDGSNGNGNGEQHS